MIGILNLVRVAEEVFRKWETNVCAKNKLIEGSSEKVNRTYIAKLF
jgi:hypothetical protein